MIGIYIIENVVNGKKYLGSSKEIEKRFRRHKKDLKNGNHHNIYLQRSWNKYGESNFIFTCIKECDINSLLDVEQEYLNEIFKTDSSKKYFYNISVNSVGGDTISNNPNREVIINNISTSLTDKYSNLSDEERVKRSKKVFGDKNPNYGNKWSEMAKETQSIKIKKYYETNTNYIKDKTWVLYHGIEKSTILSNNLSRVASERIGSKNPFFGKKHTEASKKLISSKNKGRRFINNCKPFEIDNVKYLTLSDASISLNIHITTIRYRLISKNVKFSNYQYLN